MTKKILFVERLPSGFVSVEKVFRRVAQALPSTEFATAFQQVPFSNDLASIIKNLLVFRPETADIYHVTGHIHYMVYRLARKRTVLTIHDLAFLHTRTGLRRYLLKKILLDWPLRRVKYFTVISDFTKQEVLKHTRIAAKKVRVIENPIGEHLIRRKSRPFNSLMPTILQIGTMANKNIPRLIAALEGLKCRLRIVGPLDDNISKAIANSAVEIENAEVLDDAGMLREYSDADIVAFCSTYEGFGLPIIEAQTVGTPVVTSDISPMSEVAGDGALLVDPFDPESIRNGINEIITNDELRSRLIERGFENAKRFEPGIVARKYAELYDEMIREM